MKTLPIVALVGIVFASGCSSPTLLQWKFTGGPVGQNVSAFLVDREDPAMLYAGLTNGEVHTSIDGGQTWSRISTIRGLTTIHRLLQHPETADRIYALTESGLFVSTNRGNDWKDVRVVADGTPPCRAMAIDPFKTNLLYVGLRGHGISRSTDGGGTWHPCTLGIEPALISTAEVYDIAILEVQPDIVYAAIGEIGVIKSTDAGTSWSRITEHVTYAGTHVVAIALQRKTTTHLCIGADDGTIYRSTDGGATWSVSRRTQERDGILSLDADPREAQMLFAGTGGGLITSPDFGDSWRPLSLVLPHCATHLVLSPDRRQPAFYAFGQGIGLQSSTDQGKTWVQADAGLGGSSVSSLIDHAQGGQVYGVVGQGVYAYDPRSHVWRSASSGLIGGAISSVAVDKDSASLLYAGTVNGVFQTANAGSTWQPISPALRFTPIHYLDTHPSIRTRLLMSTEQGIHASTDMGISWIRTQPYDVRVDLQGLTFSPSNAGRVYGITANDGIILSADGGFTWNIPGHSIIAGPIAAITLDPEDDRISYAWTTSGAGFRSSDEGMVWSACPVPWTVGDTVRFAFNRVQPSEAIAVLGSGEVFYSSSGGNSWTEIPAGEVPDGVRVLHWNGNTGMLYAGTRDHGVYEISLGPYLDKIAAKKKPS